jgi:DNA-binding NarL/FixJ family response regulator
MGRMGSRLTNILQKLHVRSRVEAALLAQRRELEGG